MKIISRFFFFVGLITTLILMYFIGENNLLPRRYWIAFIVIYVIFYSILAVLLSKAKVSSKNNHTERSIYKKEHNRKTLILIIVIILAIVSIAFNGFAIYYIYKGMDTLSNINRTEEKNEVDFSFVVLKDSDINDIESLDNYDVLSAIGQDNHNINLFMKDFSKKEKIDINLQDSKTYIDAASSLVSGESDVILLNEAYRSLINDQIENFDSITRVLYSSSIKLENNSKSKNVKEDEPFNVYISGIDTYGPIKSVSRSDVNLILTVNPNTNKILITSIPRDSCVYINGIKGNTDKLTHAGILGVDTSISTIEDLLDTEINYYVRVNFSSFIDIVDVLGGVDVYNDQAFTSRIGGFFFDVGNVHMNGDEALGFARERYSLAEGDLDRGRNQEKVLKAIIEKAMSPEILFNYNELMDVITDSVDTNMPEDKIVELINNQIDDNEKWVIKTIGMEGYGQMGIPSYTMPGYDLYMFVLDEDSIDNTSKSIKKVLNEQ